MCWSPPYWNCSMRIYKFWLTLHHLQTYHLSYIATWLWSIAVCFNPRAIYFLPASLVLRLWVSYWLALTMGWWEDLVRGPSDKQMRLPNKISSRRHGFQWYLSHPWRNYDWCYCCHIWRWAFLQMTFPIGWEPVLTTLRWISWLFLWICYYCLCRWGFRKAQVNSFRCHCHGHWCDPPIYGVYTIPPHRSSSGVRGGYGSHQLNRARVSSRVRTQSHKRSL